MKKILILIFTIIFLLNLTSCDTEYEEQISDNPNTINEDYILGDDFETNEIQNDETDIKSLTEEDIDIYISLNGDEFVEIYRGEEYIELGASAFDSDNNEYKVEIYGDVNTNLYGNHEIIYTTNIGNGNNITKSRIVSVIQKTDEFIDDEDFNWEYSRVHMNNDPDLDLTVEERTMYEYIQNREPNLEDNGYYKLVYIKADPENGFNFPYYIQLPKEIFNNRIMNLDIPKYAVFEVMSYAGWDGTYRGDWLKLQEDAVRAVYDYGQVGVQSNFLEQLYTPVITAIVPQPCGRYSGEITAWGDIMRYRSLNANSIKMEEAYQSGSFVSYCTDDFDVLSPSDLFGIEKQLAAIQDDAINRLKDAGWQIEDQVFTYGYSNTGHFSKNYALIYPEKVKAFYSGGAFETFVPMSVDNGFKITYPYGLYDYEELFDKEFDRAAWDMVAKYTDVGAFEVSGGTYESIGINNITNYLTNTYYPNGEIANRYLELFYYNGLKELEYDGTGMFVVNLDAGHDSGPQIGLILEFFRMNRTQREPQYFENMIFRNKVGQEHRYAIMNIETFNEEEFKDFYVDVRSKMVLSDFAGFKTDQMDRSFINNINDQAIQLNSNENYNSSDENMMENVVFIYGGGQYGEYFAEKYSFSTIRNANSMDENHYNLADAVFFVVDDNVSISDFYWINGVQNLQNNEVRSIVNQDNKRIVVLNPENEDVLLDMIREAPEDLLIVDYDYLYNSNDEIFYEQTINYNDILFIFGGGLRGEQFIERYQFTAFKDTNSMIESDYSRADAIFFIFDSNLPISEYDTFEGFENLQPNQVLSYVNPEGKRIVALYSKNDDLMIDMIQKAPIDLLFKDYDYIFK